MTVVSPRLVGRATQLARLRSHVAALAAGRGGAAIVAGEAGMGKSRLVREALADHPGPVLSGRTGVGDVALRPLVEIALAALRAGGDLDDPSVTPYRPALSAVLPDVLPVADARSDPAGPSPLVLAEGLLRLLETVGPGVAVVVEDLHWADSDTLAAVEYLIDHAVRASLLLVTTVRPEDGGTATTAAASAAARRTAELIELVRLDPAAVAEMACHCLGTDVMPPALAEFLERHAEGRPYFVEEMIAGLLDDAMLAAVDGVWRLDARSTHRVPATYAAWMAERLAAADPVVALVLRAAAVLGRDFDATLIAAMTGVDAGTLARALREGVRMQVLGPVLEGRDQLRFRHALGRDAVDGTLLPAERAALAGQGLDAVEALHPGTPPPWCDLAARLAVAAGQRARASGLLVAAGRAAAARGALAAAVDLLDNAAGQAMGNLDATAAAEEALVETLALAGNAQRALSVGYRLLRTLDAAGAPVDRQIAARLAVARAATVAGQLPEADAALTRVSAALADRPAIDPLRVRADALAALTALEAGRDSDAGARARAALAYAEAADEPAAACQALEVLGRLARTWDVAEAGRIFDRAHVIAERHGLRLWRARALHEVATVEFLVTLGIDGLRQARTAAVQAGAAGLVAAVDLHLSALHGVRFEPAEALAAGRRTVDASTRLGLRVQAGFGWVCVAQAHAIAGRRSDTEAAAATARELAPGAEVEAYLWGQCLALLSLVEEDRPRALTELGRSMHYVRSGEPVSVAPYRGLWPLLATLDGDPDAGAAARAEAGTPDVMTSTVPRGLLAYAEAVAAGRTGDSAAADASYRRGETEFARLELPQGYHQLGRRLIAEAALADGWGDPAGWLAEARDWFAGRSLDRIAGACRGLLRRAGVPQRRRGRGDTEVPPALAVLGVTSREADVLRLLALGLSNSDIAGRLYLAPRTVKTHVEHLLDKTGHTSRVQLAALAIAEGLGPAGGGQRDPRDRPAPGG